MQPVYNSFYVPEVWEKTPYGGERTTSLLGKLLKERIILLGTAVDEHVANLIMAQLLHLESEDPDKDISLYINSPGGEITGLFAIYDTMQFIKPDVSTICVGQAASMGSLLLAAGTKGKRYALPNSRIMIHQPLGGFQGQASDIEIHAKETLTIKEKLNAILSRHTGQSIEQVTRDTDRDNFKSAAEAKAYGLVDEVIEQRPSETVKTA